MLAVHLLTINFKTDGGLSHLSVTDRCKSLHMFATYRNGEGGALPARPRAVARRPARAARPSTCLAASAPARPLARLARWQAGPAPARAVGCLFEGFCLSGFQLAPCAVRWMAAPPGMVGRGTRRGTRWGTRWGFPGDSLPFRGTRSATMGILLGFRGDSPETTLCFYNIKKGVSVVGRGHAGRPPFHLLGLTGF